MTDDPRLPSDETVPLAPVTDVRAEPAGVRTEPFADAPAEPFADVRGAPLTDVPGEPLTDVRAAPVLTDEQPVANPAIDDPATTEPIAVPAVDPAAVTEPMAVPAPGAVPSTQQVPPGEPQESSAGPAGSAPASENVASGSVARNSGIMAVGSLVSRGTGFLRTAAIGAAIGATSVSTAYQSAYTLPLQIYELLLGGILTSVLVPVLVKARRNQPDGGDAFASALLSLTALFLGIVTVIAVVAAPLLTLVLADSETSEATRDLMTTLSYLMLPAMLFYGLAAMLAAVLNTRGHFAAPMWAPIVNNIVVIAVAGIFIVLHTGGELTPSNIEPWQIALIGCGTTLGVALQVAVLFPALRKVQFRWRWQLRLRGLGLRELGKLAGWMLMYVAISQVGVFVILKLAWTSDARGGPGPFVHNSAFLLFMTVHGIVAVSVITALMPRMSAAAADGRLGDMTGYLSQGTRLSSVVLVPATTAYLALGVPLAVTAFQWGQLSPDSAHAIGLGTMAAGVGLVPFAVSQLQIFAFYAMGDTKTPALINIPAAAIKAVAAWVLFELLPVDQAVVAFMTANTLSYVVAVVVSGWLLRKRLGSLDGGRVLQTLTRLSMAAVIAGLVGWGISYGVTSWLGDGKGGSFAALVLGGLALIGAFVAGAVFLRVREVTELWGSIRPRIPGLR